jgi:hypothetical protein
MATRTSDKADVGFRLSEEPKKKRKNLSKGDEPSVALNALHVLPKYQHIKDDQGGHYGTALLHNAKLTALREDYRIIHFATAEGGAAHVGPEHGDGEGFYPRRGAFDTRENDERFRPMAGIDMISARGGYFRDREMLLSTANWDASVPLAKFANTFKLEKSDWIKLNDQMFEQAEKRASGTENMVYA